MARVCEGECMERSPGDEPLTFDLMPQLYEGLEGWKSVCGRAYNVKGIKGKFSDFILFLKLCFSFTAAHF